METVQSNPLKSENLGQLRAAVDEVDGLLLELLGRRGRLVQQIQRLKGDAGRVPTRESAILTRVRGAANGPYPAETLCRIWEALFEAAPGLPEGELDA